MIARIKKIATYLGYVFRAEKSWSWPRESRVLIFDACNQEVLMEYLRPWSPEVLHVRGERINMRVLLLSLIRSGKRSDAYVDCFIERVRPRLIITFMDNNLSFFTISQRHPEVKTLFIQNGWRGYYADIFETLDKVGAPRRDALAVDYMLSFGARIGAEYSRYIMGVVVPMGSIKNNRLARKQTPQRDLIAFVSQWHNDGLYLGDLFYPQEAFFEQADRPIIQCLTNYAREKNKRLMIIPRTSRNDGSRSQEEAYFRKLLGGQPEFLEPGGFCSSYQAVDSADVVVSIDTTLGYESIARGKKTAIFPIRSSLLGVQGLTYGWPGDFPPEGPFWSNRPNPDTFIRILDHLFEIDEARWRKDIEETRFSELMIYNPGNTILTSILEKELGHFPVPQN